MVPGSTLRYGSSFWMETEMPRDLRILPRLAVVMPLPTELTTPPVTKMNFGMASRVRACSKDATGGGQGGSTNICVNWERGTGNREQGTEDREQSARATAKEHSEIGHAGVRFDWLAVGERKKSMECSRLRGGAAALEDGGEGVANEFQACGWCGDIDGDEL